MVGQGQHMSYCAKPPNLVRTSGQIMSDLFTLTEEHHRIIGKEFSCIEQRIAREMLLYYAQIIVTTHPFYLEAEAAQTQGFHDIITIPTFLHCRCSEPSCRA